MADKHHAARAARKKQKELNIKQKQSLGMDLKSSKNDFERSVIYFPELVSTIKEETIKQNGRIESVEESLDRGSIKQKDYEVMRENNDRYLKHIEKTKE